MKTTMRGKVFELQSYGNGAAYVLVNTRDLTDVAVQGEDATLFGAELDGIEHAHPEWTADQVLGWLWDQCDYGATALPYAEKG